MPNIPIVEMKGIYKSFNNVKVLENVELEIRSGEIHALMGENGAGKSTLMKVLTGIYQKDDGEIFYKGNKVNFKNPKEAEEAGIAVIHQELNIISYLTVTENLFLGKELTIGKTGILNNKRMNIKAKEYLKSLGIDIDINKPAGELSIGMQQMIEITKALFVNAEVIIMDEPTAALTDKEIRVLFEVINNLKSKGVGIIYISHRMEEIFEICDRVTVLRDGQYISTNDVKDVDFDKIVKMMVGRQIGERYPRVFKPINTEERLRVEGLTRSNVFKDISFNVYKGEILGIVGLMGAGRTEIVESIFGLNKEQGKVYIDGIEVSIKNPHDAISAGIGFIPEDRKDKGLILDLSVGENLSLPNFASISKKGIISKRKQHDFESSMINKLKIKTSGSNQLVKSLSGGNQQKIVIGKMLGINPKVLILDEPTRGVDIGAKKEIYNIMNALTEQGVSIIMVSSELPEVLGMSDRILVVHEGKIASILNHEEATQEKIMYAAAGGV